MTLPRKIFVWLLFSPALLPLVFYSGLMYPFMTPKTLLLRALGLVALALFVYLVGAGESFYWARLKSKLAWIPGALLVVAYITSIIGIDFYRSFWSIYARGDGLLTLTVIVGFFYLVLLSADKGFSTRLYTLAAWVGSGAALFAILQWIKLAGINLPIYADPVNRLGGTLGNAEFLASYLCLTFFVTLVAARSYSKQWRLVLWCGAGLQLLAVVLTATRGSFVALGVVLMLALSYWGWWQPTEKNQTGTFRKY